MMRFITFKGSRNACSNSVTFHCAAEGKLHFYVYYFKPTITLLYLIELYILQCSGYILQLWGIVNLHFIN